MSTYYDNEVTPYDDIYMEYDNTYHGYNLTDDYLDEISKGVTGKSWIAACGHEDRASYKKFEYRNDMYKFIYTYGRRGRKQRRTMEHQLAKNGDLRDAIRDAMADMARADLRSGFSMQKDLANVNPERGIVLDYSEIPPIAPDAIQGLLAEGILHAGQLTWSIKDEDYRSDY